MFLSNLFNQAGKLELLTAKYDFIQEQLDDALDEIVLLKKEVKSERDKKDKFALRFCDQLSRQNKLPERFVKDAEPPEPERPQIIETDEYRVLNYATELRNNDLAAGNIEVPPLEVYMKDARLNGIESSIY